MIYLDNSATTFPKPPQVSMAMSRAMTKFGANPGRSGHAMSIAAAEEIFKCREAAASFFHADGPECVVFTLNCTQAINMVLKGYVKPGDHIVTSCLEHNAVSRPLQTMADRMHVTFTEVAVTPGDNDATVNAFRQALKPNTSLIVCTHASNVWGIRLPVERIASLGREYGIPILVDAAQSAGVLPIDLQDSGIDFLCTAGHKGLYGPMGTGILIAKNGEQLQTIIEGGTGTESAFYQQPTAMPEHLESGTPNLAGIAGLRVGIQFVQTKTVKRIYLHEMKLIQTLYHGLKQMNGVKLYTQEPDMMHYVPVLSFNLEGKQSEWVGQKLNSMGIAVRAGLHCAPAAHRTMDTLEGGAVRVSPSVFTKEYEIKRFLQSVSHMTKNLEI